MTNFDRRFVLLLLIIVLTAGAALAQPAQPTTGPFATKAVVTAKSNGTALSLKREEQIALMFVQSIDFLLDDCRSGAAETCTLAALVRGPKKKNSGVGKLKFDPNATDPNYTYKLTVSADNSEWQIWATPKKPGLGSFYGKGKFFGGRYYKAAGGTASAEDAKLDEVGIDGDLFHTMG